MKQTFALFSTAGHMLCQRTRVDLVHRPGIEGVVRHAADEAWHQPPASSRPARQAAATDTQAIEDFPRNRRRLDGILAKSLLTSQISMQMQAIEDFPRNRRRLDGRDNRCKRCTARMVSARLKGKAPVTEPTGASGTGTAQHGRLWVWLSLVSRSTARACMRSAVRELPGFSGVVDLYLLKWC